MGWDFTPVDRPASAVKVDPSEITEQERKDFEEAVSHSLANPAQGMVVPFDTEADKEMARAKLRFLAEHRKPRVTASIWDESDADSTPPVWALNVAFKPYVKKARTPKPAATDSAES